MSARQVSAVGHGLSIVCDTGSCKTRKTGSKGKPCIAFPTIHPVIERDRDAWSTRECVVAFNHYTRAVATSSATVAHHVRRRAEAPKRHANANAGCFPHDSTANKRMPAMSSIRRTTLVRYPRRCHVSEMFGPPSHVVRCDFAHSPRLRETRSCCSLSW